MKNHLGALCLSQKWKCHYCGIPMTKFRVRDGRRHDNATVDHLIPRSRGGRDGGKNLVACCRGCNTAKGPLTAGEFWKVRNDPAALLKELRRIGAEVQQRADTVYIGPHDWNAYGWGYEILD